MKRRFGARCALQQIDYSISVFFLLMIRLILIRILRFLLQIIIKLKYRQRKIISIAIRIADR
jgi:hypothetical protein